jgi:hypothetical protein
MRPVLLQVALLAAAAVSLVAAVATTKRRFGDDDEVSVVESAAAAAGARQTPKDWGINGGQFYFDEISGEFKARPPAAAKSIKERPSKESQARSKEATTAEAVSSVRVRGQGKEQPAQLNKVLKKRIKWRKPATADGVAALGEESETEEGDSRDTDREHNGDNASDGIVDKARVGLDETDLVKTC